MSRGWVIAALSLACLCCGSDDGPAAPETSDIPPSSGPQGTAIARVANEGWAHVVEGSVVSYRSNPPASGPHYPVWLRYEEYTSTVPRGYWVHNLEHGAIVFLYRPDAPAAMVEALRAFYRSLGPDRDCGHRLALLMPDPELPRPVAAVAADWLLTADGVDAPTVAAFVAARRNRGPERVCSQGARP